MRILALTAALCLGGCAAGLDGAAGRYPPMIIGANTTPVAGPVAVRPCPAPGSRVEQKGGPTMRYLGASPNDPDLCRIQIDGDTVQAWYGIWLTDWPGAAQAHPALARVMRDGTGAIEAFDVRMAPGYEFHDLIRNEGVEHINLLGKTYDAIKLSHYREGFNGNIYRSVSTVWKDLPTGLLIYATYQHIAGTPVLDDPLIPTAILPAPPPAPPPAP